MQQQFVAGLRGLGGLAGIALPGRRPQQRLAAGQVRGQPFSRSVRGAGKLVQRLHARGERGVYLSHAPASPNPGSTISRQFQAAARACGMFLPSGGGG